MTWDEAKAKHKASLEKAGIDPDSQLGVMLRTAFLAGWKARGEAS